jgi:hypothetical protein
MTTYRASDYTLQVPIVWRQIEADQPSSGAPPYYESEWLSPDGSAGLLIDEEPNSNNDPVVSAAQIANDVRSRREVVDSLGPQKIGSYTGSLLVFTANGARPDRVDFFFHAGSSDYALLGTAQAFATARSILDQAVSSLAPTQ